MFDFYLANITISSFSRSIAMGQSDLCIWPVCGAPKSVVVSGGKNNYMIDNYFYVRLLSDWKTAVRGT